MKTLRPLTVDEKIDLLDIAKTLMEERPDVHLSICGAIASIIYANSVWNLPENWVSISIGDVLELIPELLTQKPKYKRVGNYWWKMEERQARIDVLENVITMLKEQKNDKSKML